MSEMLSHDITFFLEQVWKIPLLNQQEEIALAERVSRGDVEAKEEFVMSNIRLVISIAKKYVNRGFDFIELIQEGVFGLIRAVEKFDPTIGCRFGTYATYWITVFITKYINKNSGMLYIPTHAIQKLNKYCRLYNELSIDGCVEEDKEFKKLGIKEMGEKDFKQSEELYRITQRTFSMHDTIKGSDFVFEDIILESKDEHSYEDDILIKFDIMDAIKIVLNEEESVVITKKYGIDNTSIYTVNEIAKDMHKTKEKVRKIEKNSLSKLKKYLVKAGYENDL